MLPELGHFSLALALFLALVQSILPLIGANRGDVRLMRSAEVTAYAQVVFVGFAFAALLNAFITSDFTVLNVTNNSNSLKPMIFKIAATWGSHEGSLLLWVFILTIFGAGVAIFGSNLPTSLRARTLSVQAWISVGFLSFMLLTSNPFDRIFPPPLDGDDLNPLLQDIGLAMHPPLLYFGYVGFSIVFSFAAAALIEGRVDAAWARWVRPWTLAAWVSLTAGIALGSWWAYYELGWGGWWFWDPVENASLLPWLTGTALVHSLAVTEKRGSFKSWTVLLAISTFSLSLMGTFLVRSGVLTSVHAFANDPTRGFFILMLLAITVTLSLLVFALRAPRVSHKVGFNWLSRDSLLLINNIILVIMTVTVLLGTVYPLILDSLGLGKISVGPPYFNALFVPLTVVMCVFMGLGPVARWKSMSGRELWRKLGLAAAAAIVLGVAMPLVYGGEWNLWVSLGIVSALWIVLPMVRDLFDKTRHASSFVAGLRKLSLSYWGMVLGHVGIAVTIVGVAVVSNYNIERNVRMSPGTTVEVAGYQFTMTELTNRRGPNFLADTSIIQVQRGDEGRSFVMRPEKRLYLATGMPMTQVALRPGLFRDLYVAMGEDLGDGSYAMRVQYKPFVRWLWLGGLLMAFGGILAVADKRYRRAAARQPASSRIDQSPSQEATV